MRTNAIRQGGFIQTAAVLLLLAASAIPASGWTVSSADCGNTNPGSYGLAYVINRINAGEGDATIDFDLGPGVHTISCTATVSNRFVTLNWVSGDVRLGGSLRFLAGADVNNLQFFGGWLRLLGFPGVVHQCVFRDGTLDLSNGYTVQVSTFSNVTVNAGHSNVFTGTVTWWGDNNPVTLGSNNEMWSGAGLRLTVNGHSNVIHGAGLRMLQVSGSHNTIANNTNEFNVTPYTCRFDGTNNLIANNVFHSGQQGSVFIYGDRNEMVGNISYSNRYGLWVEGHTNRVAGNRIGLLPDGVTPGSNWWDGIRSRGNDQLIGGTNAWDGNLITASGHNGIYVESGQRATLQGNRIGLNADGDAADQVQRSGILLYGSDHVVGGPDEERNWVVGAGREGLRVESGNTVVRNNVVGLVPAGDPAAVGHNGAYDGLYVLGQNMTIRDNVVAAVTNGWGIQFRGGGVIAGNRIGTDLAGLQPVPNGKGGVLVSLGTNVTIGGTSASERNVIAAGRGATTNEGAAIFFNNNGGTVHQVLGNYIGLGADGVTVLSNAHYGILLQGTRGATIGGTNGAGNVIAGSGFAGIELRNSHANVIQGNRIGTDAAGEEARGNLHGIYLYNAGTNLIGGHPVDFGNLISGNTGDGIHFTMRSHSNVVQGNVIGLAANGSDTLGNEGYGIRLEGVTTLDSPRYNWIGGTNNLNEVWRDGNVISGNDSGGLYANALTRDLYLDGNLIGLSADGSLPAGNNGHGLHAWRRDVRVGVASGNWIGANAGDGVRFEGADAGWNHVCYNHIGVTPGGHTFPNTGHGVALVSGAKYNTIGLSLSNGYNVIGGNDGAGVFIGDAAYENYVYGNYVGYPPEFGHNVVNQGPAIQVDGARDNRIGASDGRGNVLDGEVGIHLRGSTNSWVYGNLIGFDTNQFTTTSNLLVGILVEGGQGDRFGQFDARNYVGGALLAGVQVFDSMQVRFHYLHVGSTVDSIGTLVSNIGVGVHFSNTVSCQIHYSHIGTGSEGVHFQHTLSNEVQYSIIGAADYNPEFPMGHRNVGVLVEAGAYDAIGGQYSPNNTISGNNGHGVAIYDSTGVVVRGNLIGLNPAGDAVLTNQGHGVYIHGGTNISVGGQSLYRNFIGGNTLDGIHVRGAGERAGHTIAANRVGLLTSGTEAAPNGGHGILLHDVGAVTVGGPSDLFINFIAGNQGHGVLVTGALTTAHILMRNRIGLDWPGTNALPNAGHGMALYEGPGHRIEANFLSGNAGHGLLLSGTNTGGAVISDNRVGIGAGTRRRPNGADGIALRQSPANVVSNNWVAGNLGHGILIADAGGSGAAAGNQLLNNQVGVSGAGVVITNEGSGVCIQDANQTVLRGNLVGGNAAHGILLTGANARDTLIQANWIGVTTGGVAAPNAVHGLCLAGGGNNRVGSTNALTGNVVAWNVQHGVAVESGLANPILGNAIYSNGYQGIRLGTQEFSQAESPLGPNRYQRQPAITNVFRGSTHIFGELETEADGEYLVEFFATESTNAAGFGEGRYVLARETLITDGAGRAPFAFVLPETVSTGWLVTATATDTNGNTSTFSPFAVVGEAPDTHGYGVPDFYQEQYSLTYTELGEAYTKDSDGDGFTDWEEYVAGTHPQNINAFLDVGLGSLDIPYTSVGRRYTVERTTDLVGGEWVRWDDSLGTDGPLYFDIEDEETPSAAFRVRAEIP